MSGNPGDNSKPDPQMQQRIIKFALIEGAVNLLFLLPMLTYLFVYPNGLAERHHTMLLAGTLAVWALISAILVKVYVLPRT